MFTLWITLKSGKQYPLDFYSFQVAVECGRDHLRAPDVAEAVVVDKATQMSVVL